MCFYDIDVGAGERLREVLGAAMARLGGGVETLCAHQLPVQPQVATICTQDKGGPSHREASASTSDARLTSRGLPTS